MSRYRIRPMEPRDVAAVQKLHDEQNARDGTNYPLTEVFDSYSWTQNPRVPLALVILDGEEVKQAAIFVADAVEMMLAGCDAKATATLHREIASAFYLLQQKGYTGVDCKVPRQVVGPIAKPLNDVGFERDDDWLAHFYKSLTTETES